MNRGKKYVLVTPTKDEEATIGSTIDSVVSQTLLPAEWVIVSDGSSDGTEDIIRQAQQSHQWIRLISLPPGEGRCFGAVARAAKLAVESLTVDDYEYIGLLDSDLSFREDYFERVLERFEADSKLGVAGGLVVDPGEDSSRIPDNPAEVPGAVQFFRRSCFEKLREIHAIPEGGWDTLTCAEARLNGFTTKLLSDLVIDHLKPRNVGEGGIMRRKWQLGVREYVIGYHPVFEVIKCLRRIRERPYVFSAVARFVGYASAFGARKNRAAPEDLMRLIQAEQVNRVKDLFMPNSGQNSR